VARSDADRKIILMESRSLWNTVTYEFKIRLITCTSTQVLTVDYIATIYNKHDFSSCTFLNAHVVIKRL
jgi:hypothetical protein